MLHLIIYLSKYSFKFFNILKYLIINLFRRLVLAKYYLSLIFDLVINIEFNCINGSD